MICGHIHQPEIKKIETNAGSVTYLNSGDWVENLTALEYYDGKWHLFSFKDNFLQDNEFDETNEDDEDVLETKVLFQNMMKEFRADVKQYKSTVL